MSLRHIVPFSTAQYSCAVPCVLVGMDSQGLYRMSGFHGDVEAVKMSFDKCEFLWNICRRILRYKQRFTSSQ